MTIPSLLRQGVLLPHPHLSVKPLYRDSSMQDLVDIVVPTYHGAAFLSELLDSLLNQTYSNTRILLRDDGSKDQTLPIISLYSQKYPQKVILISDGKANLGIMGNYAELLHHVQANYVCLADQDDVWLPHKIELSMCKIKTMERRYGDDHPLLIHTDLQVVDKDLKEINPSFWKYANLKPKYQIFNRLLLQNCVTGCTITMNRSLLNLILPIPQEAVMHDWWMALIASCFGHIHHCDESTILYRQHSRNALGAIRSSWKDIITSRWMNRPENNSAREQARAFLKHFKNRLDRKKRKTVQTFCEIKDVSYIMQRWQMFRYGFFKHSHLRNAGRILLPFKY